MTGGEAGFVNQVMEALLQRRSCKKYLPDPVPDELVDQIVTAGTYAPSARGRQSGKIVVITDPEDIAALETRNAIIRGNPGLHTFYGAPVVIAVLADANNANCVQDGSLILGNMLLAAHSLGLGSCWINRAKEEFDSEEGRKLLAKWKIEGDWRGVGYCIVGYPDGAPMHAAPRKPDYVVYPYRKSDS